MRRLVALLCVIHAEEEIVSIVTTAEGFERGATASQLPAYDLYNRAVHAASINDMAPAVQMLEEAYAADPKQPRFDAQSQLHFMGQGLCN